MASIIDRLAVATLLRRDELMALIRSAPHRYKVFQIEKRRKGSFRTIAQPSREVKKLQYWVIEHVLKSFSVHEAAVAYRKGRSIRHNAARHVRGRFLLKMDFVDFFPSIKAADFEMCAKRASIDLDAETLDALCRVLFWKPKGKRNLCLSIGAPSSPLLSNIILWRFDERIASACRKYRVTYTRYADDLTFSSATSAGLEKIEHAVEVACRRMKSPILTINRAKTVRVSMRDSRRVTGLILTNDRHVSLGRDFKRALRASVHHFVTGRLDAGQVERLAGMLAYVRSVEPSFLQRLEEKYGAQAIDGLRGSGSKSR